MLAHPSFSILLFTLLAAGCGAKSSLGSSEGSSGSGGSTGSTASTTDTAGTGASTGSTTGTTTATVDTYTMCAEGNWGPNGNIFLDTFGVEDGAQLTVTPQGATLAATFVNLNGKQGSLTFDTTTGTSAALAPGGASIPGFAGMCVYGPGDTELYPASLTAASGALEYTGSTMFLALTGTMGPSDPGACSTQTEPEDVWIVCGTGTGFPPAPPSPVEPAPAFPAGAYSCTSQVGTYGEGDGLKEYVTAGGPGTLTLTESGTKVTAAYTGDMYISGTLDFTLATPTSAHADAGQTLSAQCLVPFNPMGPSPPFPPEPLSVGAGSLVWLNDTSLFLMLSGTMSSSCPGVVKMGAILCTKQ